MKHIADTATVRPSWRRPIFAVLLAIALLVPAIAVCATTHYVSTTGSDETGTGAIDKPWATMTRADASGSLAPGDTVLVAAGTYTQSTLNGVTISNTSGSAGSPITYKADGAVVIDQSAFPGESYGIKVAANMHDLVFEGFEISFCQWGFYFSDYPSNVVVTKCHIHDMVPADPYGTSPQSWTGGIWMSHPDHCTISYNLIHYVSGADWAACLFLPGMTNCDIYNNTLADSGIGIQDWLNDAIYAGNKATNNVLAYLSIHAMSTGSTGGILSRHNLFFEVNANAYYAGRAVGGLGDIVGDPYLGADYTLQDGSRAINAGLDLGKPFNGWAPDLGAFETTSTEATGAVTGHVRVSATQYRGERVLPGVTVECGSLATVTDANGEYRLALPTGEQTLNAYDLTGALPALQANVTITALQTTIQDFVYTAPEGTTYYVSTTGSDETGDGTEGNPWATIGYADANGKLIPGDVVIVAAGTYPQADAAGVVIATSGSLVAPIVYKTDGPVVIDQSSYTGVESHGITLALAAHDLYFDGFEVKNCTYGIVLGNSEDIVVTRCKFHDIQPLVPSGGYGPGWCGGVSSSYCKRCTVSRSLFYNIGTPGDKDWEAGLLMLAPSHCKFYNNTFANSGIGIQDWEASESGNVATNNIFKGLWAFAIDAGRTGGTTNSYNLFYQNSTDYGVGISKGVGEFNADPLLNADYTLPDNSPALNVGIDVGLPFNCSAPDLGAFESESCNILVPGTVTGVVKSLGSAYRPAGPTAGVTVASALGGFSTVTGSDGTFALNLTGGPQVLKVTGAPDTPVTVIPNQTVAIPDIVMNPVGNTYHVSTTGSDTTGDGSAAKPWQTIGHADSAKIIKAGDVVLVEAGTYPQSSASGTIITVSGTPPMPIVYKANGRVVIDQAAFSGASQAIYTMPNSHDLVFDGFEFAHGQWGMYVDNYPLDFVITNCTFHGQRAADLTAPLPAAWCAGVWVSHPTRFKVHNNLFYDIGVPGAWNTCMLLPAMRNNEIYNNTFADSTQGICDWLNGGFTGSLVTNNIFKGMSSFSIQSGEANGVTVSHNLHFGTPVNGTYLGPVVIGEGEITDQDPLLAADYTLLDGSPAIDAGTDVGLPFDGDAPDIGAFERWMAVPVPDIKDLTGIPDGRAVSITNPKTATVGSGTFADSSVYVQEASRLLGIKVVAGSKTIAVGDSFTLAGTLGTDANGERTITLGSIGAVTPGAEPKTLGLRNGFVLSVAPHLSGTLARLWGKVTYKDANYMYIDDGTNCNDGNAAGHLGIRVALDGLSAPITKSIVKDNYVTVTGVLGLAKDGAVTVSALRPRGDADIVVNP